MNQVFDFQLSSRSTFGTYRLGIIARHSNIQNELDSYNSMIQAVMEAWTRFCETMEKCVLICVQINWEMLLMVGRKDSVIPSRGWKGMAFWAETCSPRMLNSGGWKIEYMVGTEGAKEKPRA